MWHSYILVEGEEVLRGHRWLSPWVTQQAVCLPSYAPSKGHRILPSVGLSRGSGTASATVPERNLDVTTPGGDFQTCLFRREMDTLSLFLVAF
jgi:hypothetical protein